MARKQRLPKARRARLTRRDFTAAQELKMVLGWSPPVFDHERACSRWQTWAEYVSDYEQVRDELEELYSDRRDGRPLFAERALRLRDEQGGDVLAECSYEDVRSYPEGWNDAA